MTLLDHPRSGERRGRAGSTEVIFREAKQRERRRRAAIGLALLVAGAIAAATAVATGKGGHPAAARPAFPTAPPGLAPVVDLKAFAGEGELAFVSRGGLWLLNGNGHTLTALPVPNGLSPSSPAVSPDGRWVAYLASGSKGSALVVANAGGTEARQLSASTTSSGPMIIGWSPTRDTLAYVTPAGRSQYAPRSRVELWTPRHSRLLVSYPEVEGGAWSPDGSQLAVMSDTDIPRAKRSWTASITAFPLGGGQPTTWITYSDTYSPSPNGPVTSAPAMPGGRNVAYVDPLGWWPRWGIGYAVVEGSPGSPFDSSLADGGSLPLVVLARPHAVPRVVGSSMINGATGFLSASYNGQLAFTDANTARPIWQEGRVLHCAPSTLTCAPVVQPPGTVSMDPMWSPDGGALAYVVGSSSSTGGFDQAGVQRWYDSLGLDVFRPATGATSVSHLGKGAVVPLWSSNGKSLLFVRSDGVWIWSGLRGRPVEVARPLFDPANWQPYFGQVAWTAQFSWRS